MMFDNDEFNGYVKQLADVFQELDYNIIPLIAYGWGEIGTRKKQTILNTLFGMDMGEKLLEQSRLMPTVRENNISKNTLNMAYIYNTQRFNELHAFCKKNGYGYLITDDRKNSIYDIMHRTVDPELVECLNAVLNKQTMIVWENVKEIKQTRAVSNADIAAYVLQNKLHFTMRPFRIKKMEPF